MISYLKKLSIYGIRGVMYNWIKDYITNRWQYVSVQNIRSTALTVTCGVPQGSILGPLLFLLYANDIGNVLPDKIVKICADDINIFIFNQDISAISITANDYLYHLSQWFVANKLSLNVDKTCLVTFAIPKQIDLIIMIGKTKIINLDHCKYLGVYIDRDPNGLIVLISFAVNLKKYTGIYRLRNKLPVRCLKMLYFAFVHPHLLHGIEIYANTSLVHLSKILTLNNKILRILHKWLCYGRGTARCACQ